MSITQENAINNENNANSEQGVIHFNHWSKAGTLLFVTLRQLLEDPTEDDLPDFNAVYRINQIAGIDPFSWNVEAATGVLKAALKAGTITWEDVCRYVESFDRLSVKFGEAQVHRLIQNVTQLHRKQSTATITATLCGAPSTEDSKADDQQ